MDEKELQSKLNEISSGMRWIDIVIGAEWDKKEGARHYLTKKQAGIFKKILELFRELNWQIALNNYQQLIFDKDTPPIKTGGCGKAVRVRPCGEKYGDKTYLGILLGDMPLQLSASIDEDSGDLTIKRSMYNPAILIPELGEIVYGCGSWWGEIDSEEELKDMITDDTIKNCWYVRLLNAMGE